MIYFLIFSETWIVYDADRKKSVTLSNDKIAVLQDVLAKFQLKNVVLLALQVSVSNASKLQAPVSESENALFMHILTNTWTIFDPVTQKGKTPGEQQTAVLQDVMGKFLGQNKALIILQVATIPLPKLFKLLTPPTEVAANGKTVELTK